MEVMLERLCLGSRDSWKWRLAKRLSQCSSAFLRSRMISRLVFSSARYSYYVISNYRYSHIIICPRTSFEKHSTKVVLEVVSIMVQTPGTLKISLFRRSPNSLACHFSWLARSNLIVRLEALPQYSWLNLFLNSCRDQN